MGIEPDTDHPNLLRYLFRSCCDLDLELRPGTAMDKSDPRHQILLLLRTGPVSTDAARFYPQSRSPN
jgi:hypothetical protein